MKLLRIVTLLVTITLTSAAALSQDTGEQALSDIKISYTYSDGGAVELTIRDNKLGYLWTAGDFEGSRV